MDNTNLNPQEIQNLIHLYKSELRKLHFQYEKTLSTVNELQDLLGTTKTISEPKATYNLPKSPAVQSTKPVKKAATKKTTTKKRRKRRRSKGGYKLSDWDKFIINTVREMDNPTINNEILVVAKEEYPDVNEETLKGRISRAIHKLANKRNILVKHKYEGRGFAYTVNPNASWK